MTATAAAGRPAARPRRSLVAPSLYRIEIIRQLRNPFTLVFTLGMPIAMYLIFGAFSPWGDEPLPHGNTKFQIMVSMAAFGTATAMSSLCSLAASEVRQGWGRQIAMTPLPIAGYALTKIMAALTFSAMAVVAVFVAGMMTGAQTDDAWRWLVSAAVILAGGTLFGLWGMGVGMLLNPDSAAALASIAITVFGFIGNVFMPLDGAMLDVARFTPLYGYVSLARWPVTDGALLTGQADPLWAVVLNIAAWAAIFLALALAGVVRSRRRA